MSDEVKDQNEYPQYKIEYQNALTYENGFAEGYARAWKECWEYFIEIANTKKEETP